jgi:glycosyltransferase involved in cell wall biosynthesis
VYTKYLTRELVRLGHSVEVFSGPPYPELDSSVKLTKIPSLDLYREPDPFRVPRVSEFHTLADLGEFLLMCTGAFPEPRSFGWRVASVLGPRLGEFDLVHDNQSLSWPVLRFQARGMPVVVSIHHPITVDRKLGLQSARTLKEKIGLQRFYGFLRMQCAVARRMRRVITVSEASCLDICAQMSVKAENISVVPVGVDTKVFRRLPEIERQKGLIVTTASSDVPLKGLRYLVEAVRIIKERGDLEVQLKIIGARRPESEVHQLVERFDLSESVSFLGTLEQEAMVELYARASVAVVPSLYEGFSLPTIEAMACGTPLVVTDGGALPEVVGEAGEAALVARAGDARDLAGKVAEALMDPLSALDRADRGLQRVVERYSWRAAALGTVKAYETVLSRSPSSTRATQAPSGDLDDETGSLRC